MSIDRARFPQPPPPDMSGAPPGPRLPRDVFGAEWLLREHRLLERCRGRYGDVFSLKMWPLGLLVVVCDPAEIKRVFTSDPETVRAGEGNAVTEPVAGPESVLLLDGKRHLSTRKLMLPSFHGERIAVYGELIDEITDAEVDRWPLRTPFAVHPSMQTITLRVILRAVFGIEDVERLLRNPAVLDRLRAEFAGDDEGYLDCVIKESLRSRPIIPYAMRRLAAPMEIGGYTVPAGAFVGSSTILTHSRADLYPEPDAFRPERFQDGGADTYTWIPFGGGVRRCLGASFATFEMKVILRHVLARCELAPPDSKPEHPRLPEASNKCASTAI